MIKSDLAGVALVYIYVAILLIITEKLLSKYPSVSRKVLHIMVGNVAFILPIFETKEIMAFIAAGPFIIFTFLMSPYTPIKSIRGKTSAAGHGMCLVYYSITWTILAYLFFDNMVVIAIGILAMSYGDGFASLLGVKFGKRKYKVFGDEKSYIGSTAMFLFTFITTLIAIFYYNVSITTLILVVLVLIAFISALIEGVTPKGVYNLTVPFVAAFIYWIVFLIWCFMRLIIVDGLDGVGKDTQAQLIKTRYERKGERIVLRPHPSVDNYFGKKAKAALLGKGKIKKLEASIFYMMDILRSIRKYYRKKDVDTLIMVRYLVGTAYLPFGLAKIAYRFFENFVPVSEYMFFLDATPDEMSKRIEARKEKEMFETLEELKKVRDKALFLVRNWYIIDASGTIEDTFNRIEKVLIKLDKNH